MSRQPNGYGSCHKIGGAKKRKNQYRARVTDGWEWDEAKGKFVQKYITIGYFATRKEGNMALAEYHKNPVKKKPNSPTFEDIYKMWLEFKKPAKKSLQGYTTAYGHCKPLYAMKMSDIRAEHLEKIMQNITVGIAGQKIIKTLWNQMFEYAIGRDYIDKNYSKHVKTKDKNTNESSRVPFTKEEVQVLWDNVKKNRDIETILMYIYTGMRPSELLEICRDDVNLEKRYMVGGLKTEAGRNRVIPISRLILPIVERRLQESEWLISFKGRADKYDRYLESVWHPIMEQLNMEHTPHECRHTFVSFMTEVGVDERLLKKIVGHSTRDITARYTHLEIAALVKAVDQLEELEGLESCVL